MEFGHLMHETWKYKKSLSDSMSSPAINSIYTEALKAGAL